MSVQELPKPSDDVAPTLQQVLDGAEDLEFVVVLAIKKNGQQLIHTSTGNMHQKSFLATFYNTWLAHWFQLSDL